MYDGLPVDDVAGLQFGFAYLAIGGVNANLAGSDDVDQVRWMGMHLLFAARRQNAFQHPDALIFKLKANAVSVDLECVLGGGRYRNIHQQRDDNGNHEGQKDALFPNSHRPNETKLRRGE